MTTVGADITMTFNADRMALDPVCAVVSPGVAHIHYRFDRKLRGNTP
jgi:hypothetical protein